MKKNILRLLVLCGFLLWVSAAHAERFSFYNITNNNAGDASIGEAQLWVDVTAVAGGNDVLFTFRNLGLAASSITDVYFDDGVNRILNSIGAFNGVGVAFSPGANPGNLPGRDALDPDFAVTANLLADSNPPVQRNGVNPGDQLGIQVALISPNGFADVISELNSGELRIGIHVQGFATGGSESFATARPSPVSEPATMLLLGSGVIGVATLGRRRLRRS